MTLAHTQDDIREERRRRLREALAANSNTQDADPNIPERIATGSEPVQLEAVDIQDTQTSSLQTAASAEHMRILEDIRAGKKGDSSVRCIPQGDEYATGKCLFHYTVTTITDECFSGTFTIDVHFPYRLVSQSQSLGGMYQRIILTQTYPGAGESGDQPSALGRSVDLINLELDINTARVFYKDVASQMDAAVQGELEALKPPMKEVTPSSPETKATEQSNSGSTSDSSRVDQAGNASAPHAERHPSYDTSSHHSKDQPPAGDLKAQKHTGAVSKQHVRAEQDEGRRPTAHSPSPEQPSSGMPITQKILMLTGGVLLSVTIALLFWVLSIKMNPTPLPMQPQAQPKAPLAQPHTPNGAQNTEEDTLWQPN
jgi:hypothetical protein